MMITDDVELMKRKRTGDDEGQPCAEMDVFVVTNR